MNIRNLFCNFRSPLFNIRNCQAAQISKSFKKMRFLLAFSLFSLTVIPGLIPIPLSGPEGFRLPGQTLSALEAGDPFPELDLKSAKPFYTKKPVLNFYRVKKKLKNNDRKKRNFYLRLPEEPVMKLCGENDGSPNVLLAVLLAKSVWRMDPENRQPVTTAIAINHKAILGNHESWQTFSDTAIVDYPKKIAGWSLSKLCTITRGQIMLQVQPENSASYIKNIKRAQRRFSMKRCAL